MMRGLLFGVLATFAFLVPCGRAAAQARVDATPDRPSEIVIERIYGGCENCPDHKLVLRREGGKQYEAATVTRINLHTNKRAEGKLRAYYYNNLLRLIESQGYFDMRDEYEMNWVDSTIVNLSVTVGDRRKVIRTQSEGRVPIQLWGIYYAIDGAAARTNWVSGR